MGKMGFLSEDDKLPKVEFDVRKEIELIKKRLDAIERGESTYTEFMKLKQRWEE